LHDLPALAPDLPGFGASPSPGSVIGADGYADIVAQILDDFDEPPVLIGHSFGGRVAVCLAARMPERVGPLVLTGVPLLRKENAKKPALSYRLIRGLHKFGVVSSDRMELERQKRGSADYRAVTGVMREILVKVVHESYESQLSQVRSPVVMLWGSNDSVIPVTIAEEAALLVENADLEVLDGVGHHVPTEAPDALRRVIDSVMS
jgi:pimeloyl-ACP methyl ester carboxylesterase